jgi:hypothetical protein
MLSVFLFAFRDESTKSKQEGKHQKVKPEDCGNRAVMSTVIDRLMR